jgi:hypothetical protein
VTRGTRTGDHRRHVHDAQAVEGAGHGPDGSVTR